MTALPNTRSMLSSAIDTVNRPYADSTATTQETVSRVSSLNFSSIDEDGELLSSCSGGSCTKQLPSSFPLVSNGRMHGKRRTGRDGVHRHSGQTWSWSSRLTPWARVLFWHATATINSSLALGNDGFGPKRLAEPSIASILGTATTIWSTALACDNGSWKKVAERRGPCW
jgi:hypothetical protein